MGPHVEGHLTGKVYGTILEVLSTGLYPNKLDVLREYIQNAYDGIKAARRTGIANSGRIDIRTEGSDLVITDDGAGISGQNILDFGDVGASNKYDPGDTWFRGIGRLSGICAADELAFVTKVQGESVRHLVRFRAGDMIRDNDEHLRAQKRIPVDELVRTYGTVESRPEARDRHYTTVVLRRINKGSSVLLDDNEVDRYVAEIAPVDFSPSFEPGDKIRHFLAENVPHLEYVDIYVNNVKVVKPYTDDQNLENLRLFKVVDRRDRNVATCWSMMNEEAAQIDDDKVAGLRMRVKGMGVGTAEYMGTILSMTQPTLFYWIAGEVHVTDEDCKPSSDRNQLVDNEARRALYNELKRQLGIPLEIDARGASEESAVRKKISKARSILQDAHDLAHRPLTAERKAAEVDKLDRHIEKVKRALIETDVSPELEEEAETVVLSMKTQIQALRQTTQDLDVPRALALSGESIRLYETFTDSVRLALRREFGFSAKKIEDMLQSVSEELIRRWKRK